MAVAPLFVVDKATLLLALRLEGTKQAGALAKIDRAIEDVRLSFYERLGVARIGQIKATAYAENPTTDAGIIRARANSIEVMWVDLLLHRRMPTLYLDASGVKQQVWNDEGAFASTPEQKLQKEIERLEADINEGLAVLEGSETIGDEKTISAATIGPECPGPLPGSSVFGRRAARGPFPPRLKNAFGPGEG